MKNIILTILITLILFSSCKEEETIPEQMTVEPTNLTDKFSYVYGQKIASSFASSNDEINLEYVINGIEDAIIGLNHYNVSETNEVINSYQKEAIKNEEVRIKKEETFQLEFLNSFLSTNKKRKDIISIDDKLQYLIIKENPSGEKANINSNVTLEYEIKILSGDIKDSTYEKGEKLTVDIENTFLGFREIVIRMREGERFRAWIHPDYAFSNSGYGNIMPNELLIVDIELISVNNI